MKPGKLSNKLGVWLRNFTDKKAYPKTYDASFVKKIRKLVT